LPETVTEKFLRYGDARDFVKRYGISEKQFLRWIAKGVVEREKLTSVDERYNYRLTKLIEVLKLNAEQVREIKL
jgi:hypothetical protein